MSSVLKEYSALLEDASGVWNTLYIVAKNEEEAKHFLEKYLQTLKIVKFSFKGILDGNYDVSDGIITKLKSRSKNDKNDYYTRTIRVYGDAH